MIPGLWDMHVHLPFKMSESLHLPLFIAHGVTGVRGMASDCVERNALMNCAEDFRSKRSS